MKLGKFYIGLHWTVAESWPRFILPALIYQFIKLPAYGFMSEERNYTNNLFTFGIGWFHKTLTLSVDWTSKNETK